MLNKLSEFISSSRLARYLAIGLVIFVSVLALNNIWDLWARFGWVSPAPTQEHTMAVSAEGKVTASPDTARIQVSVVTDGKTADIVQKKNTADINKVIDFIKSNGVEAKDIKTTFYSLYPKYNYINGRQTPAGFTLSQTLDIKIRDLKKVGGILTGAIGRGANQVSGVDFFIDDPDSFRAEARAEAFAKARSKAKELAKLAQVRLGGVVTFSESYSGQPPIFYEKAMGLGGGYAGGAVPDIQSGSQEIIVNVSVVFEIR